MQQFKAPGSGRPFKTNNSESRPEDLDRILGRKATDLGEATDGPVRMGSSARRAAGAVILSLSYLIIMIIITITGVRHIMIIIMFTLLSYR